MKAAQDRLTQIRQDIGNRKETNVAAIAVQEAARRQSRSGGRDGASENIDALTLKAHRDGYVSIQQNTSGNFFFGA